jgi:endonuclease G
MRTVNFLSAAAILAATVMTSCSRSAEDANSNDRVEVKFASAQASVETRVADADWTAGDPIGIYMVKATPGTLADGNILEDVSNRQYEAATAGAMASFTPATDAIYYPANQGGSVVDVKFIAYHPYGTVSNNSSTFVRGINVSDQSVQSAIDFLYAPAGASYNKNSGTVTLPFVHKLVKLEFIIGNDASVTAALAGLTVNITGQETVSTLDLTNGDVPVSDGGSATITALPASAGTEAEAIVLPNSATTGMSFIFTNSIGEEFTGNIPDPKWDGGKKYIYTVTLKKNEAVIEGEIQPWDNGNGSGLPVDAE